MDIRELGMEYCDLKDLEDELEEDDVERLKELEQLNTVLEEALYYYNTAGSDCTIIEYDDRESYTKEYMLDVNQINFGTSGLEHFINWLEVWEHYLEDEFFEFEFEGTKYMAQLR